MICCKCRTVDELLFQTGYTQARFEQVYFNIFVQVAIGIYQMFRFAFRGYKQLSNGLSRAMSISSSIKLEKTEQVCLPYIKITRAVLLETFYSYCHCPPSKNLGFIASHMSAGQSVVKLSD